MFDKTQMVAPESALPGRDTPLPLHPEHFVKQVSMFSPFPLNFEVAYFAMGCFWGVERLFWQQDGVYTTAVGYQGGYTPNPTYDEVCSGRTGHTESVMVVYDPSKISYSQLLKVFWENHDPAQGARQGNDIGTQYRSMLFTTTAEQQDLAQKSLSVFQNAMNRQHDNRVITTEITDAQTFYFAEQYHQQYLAKNPHGYCGIAGIGVCLPPA